MTGQSPTEPVNHSTPNLQEAMNALAEEIRRARAKFPGSDRLMAALLEEVGELAEELVHNRVDTHRVRLEALQVACVAVRIAEEMEGLTFRERHMSLQAVELGKVARSYLEGVESKQAPEGRPPC